MSLCARETDAVKYIPTAAITRIIRTACPHPFRIRADVITEVRDASFRIVDRILKHAVQVTKDSFSTYIEHVALKQAVLALEPELENEHGILNARELTDPVAEPAIDRRASRAFLHDYLAGSFRFDWIVIEMVGAMIQRSVTKLTEHALQSCVEAKRKTVMPKDLFST